eukprot:NODE_262_length_11424_cov_0.885828.p6 type:complete len:237 gc:universal NODE_262_length_11424_cov_0.885828:8261-7551(-)
MLFLPLVLSVSYVDLFKMINSMQQSNGQVYVPTAFNENASVIDLNWQLNILSECAASNDCQAATVIVIISSIISSDSKYAILKEWVIEQNLLLYVRNSEFKVQLSNIQILLSNLDKVAKYHNIFSEISNDDNSQMDHLDKSIRFDFILYCAFDSVCTEIKIRKLLIAFVEFRRFPSYFVDWYQHTKDNYRKIISEDPRLETSFENKNALSVWSLYKTETLLRLFADLKSNSPSLLQ